MNQKAKRRLLTVCVSLIAANAYAGSQSPSPTSNLININTSEKGPYYSSGITSLSDDGKTAGGWLLQANDYQNLYPSYDTQGVIWSGDDYHISKSSDVIVSYYNSDDYTSVSAVSGDGSAVAFRYSIYQGVYAYNSFILRGSDFSEKDIPVIPDHLHIDRPHNNYNLNITALSHDGKVATGFISAYDYPLTDFKRRSYYRSGFIWRGEHYDDVVDLTRDNFGDDKARLLYAISDDGDVVAGKTVESSDNDDNRTTNSLWIYDLSSTASVWSGDNWKQQRDLALPAQFSKGDYPFAEVTALSGLGDIAAGNISNVYTSDSYGSAEYRSMINSALLTYNNGGRWVNSMTESVPPEKVRRQGIVWSGPEMKNITVLKGTDNSQLNGVNAISRDGRVVAGWVEGNTEKGSLLQLASSNPADRPYHAAVIWSGNNWGTVTNLQQDMGNILYSEALAVNADGTIVGGAYLSKDDYKKTFDLKLQQTLAEFGDNDDIRKYLELELQGSFTWMPHRAALWKITWPEPVKEAAEQPSSPSQPETPSANPDELAQPKVTMIDLMNTHESIYRTGSDALSALEMQRNALLRLHDSCVNGHQGEFCYSLKTGMTADGDDKDIYGGFTLGYGLNDYLTAGISLDHSFSRSMPDSFGNAGNNLGGGVFVHLRQPVGEHEFYIEPSFAFSSTDVDITRSTSGLTYTEKARGVSRIKGTGASLETGFNFSTTERVRTGIYVGARHSRVQRDAYTERNAAFPVSYDDMVYSSTVALAGARLNVELTESLSWNSGIEVERELVGKKVNFAARGEYTPEEKYGFDMQNRTRGTIKTGLFWKASPSVTVGVQPELSRTAISDNVWGGVLSVAGGF